MAVTGDSLHGHPTVTPSSDQPKILSPEEYSAKAALFLGKLQKKIIKHLEWLNRREIFTSYRIIAEEVDASEGIVRKTFQQLKEAGIILPGGQGYDPQTRRQGQMITYLGPIKGEAVTPQSDTLHGQPVSPSKIDRILFEEKEKTISLADSGETGPEVPL